MASDKAHVTEVGNVASNGSAVPATKPSFGSRVAAHYKKWWWLHLIAFIIVVLVVVLPVVYVGYPNIAQGDVTDSTLNVTEMIISDPKPGSFHLNQRQVIGTDSHWHPTIYSFSAAVSLVGAATPFTNVQVPRVKSNDGTVVNIDQRVNLNNASAFGDFAQAVMLSEEIGLNIYGKPHLKQGGLPKITVTYNETVTMKALNKLQGFNVTDFQILLSPLDDGTNLNGTVYIPNPSVMTITMGNLTLDLSVDGTRIGQSYLKDLVLKPGNNTVPMTAVVDQIRIIGMLTGDNAKYPNGILPVDIIGNSSVYNGQELPYFTQALSSNVLRVNLNAGHALAALNITL